VAELVWQLRGEAGARQVTGAQVGLAYCSGGFIGHDSRASIEEQKELARHGAYLEYSFTPCLPSPLRESQPIQTIIDMANRGGADHCVLGTDLGRFTYPPPVEGLRMFIAGLLLGGVKEKDIERMVRINPAYLLGL